MHPDQARQSGIQGEAVEVSSASGKVTLALDLDTHIPLGCIWIPLGYPETSGLAAPYLPCSVAMAALLPETQRAS